MLYNLMYYIGITHIPLHFYEYYVVQVLVDNLRALYI